MNKKMDSKSLEKRLSSVKDSSEDIQALSRWCIQHKNHHHSIVQAWSRAVRKAKVGHRLTLLYVCNDIVQNARRKKYTDLVQFFGTAVKEIAPLVRDDKIKKKVMRIFRIWEERGIYDAKLISHMIESIENVGSITVTDNETMISSFQLTKLEEGIRNLLDLHDSSKSLLLELKTQENFLTEEEICKLQTNVKERGAGGDRLEEFEDSVLGLECYISALQRENDDRARLVTLLEQAEIFYETQRGEAKLVANAYRTFNTQVSTLNTKLTEVKKKLHEPDSPITSPCVDAPSPTPSDGDDDISILNSANKDGVQSFLDSNNDIAMMAQEVLQSDKEETGNHEKTPIKSANSFCDSEYRNCGSYDDRSHHRSDRIDSGTINEPLKDSSPKLSFKPYTEPLSQETKPMSAKELLDTFGKSYNSSKSTSFVHEVTPPYISETQPCVSSFPESIPLPPIKENLFQPPPWTPPVWNRPPPPPPPLPPVLPSNHSSYSSNEWNQFDNYEEIDDETDNRNWGEVPGTEELEALSSVQPPPLPPSLPAISIKSDRFYGPEGSSPPGSDYDEISTTNRHLVKLDHKPSKGDSFNYPCYDYRSLTQDSMTADNIKKKLGKGKDSSGSDMDISDSDSTDASKRGSKRNKRSNSIHLDSEHRPRTIIPLTDNSQSLSDNQSKQFISSTESFKRRGSFDLNIGSASIIDNVDTLKIAEALKHIESLTPKQSSSSMAAVLPDYKLENKVDVSPSEEIPHTTDVDCSPSRDYPPLNYPPPSNFPSTDEYSPVTNYPHSNMSEPNYISTTKDYNPNRAPPPRDFVSSEDYSFEDYNNPNEDYAPNKDFNEDKDYASNKDFNEHKDYASNKDFNEHKDYAPSDESHSKEYLPRKEYNSSNDYTPTDNYIPTTISDAYSGPDNYNSDDHEKDDYSSGISRNGHNLLSSPPPTSTHKNEHWERGGHFQRGSNIRSPFRGRGGFDNHGGRSRGNFSPSPRGFSMGWNRGGDRARGGGRGPWRSPGFNRSSRW